MINALLNHWEMEDHREPYNFSFYDAVGDVTEYMDDMPRVGMIAAFVRECFERFEYDLTIQDVSEECVICWDRKNNILAILKTHELSAKFAIVQEEQG